MRYVLIDRIVRLVPGQMATALKNVSLSDDLVTRYATGASALPSAMLLESMAQTAGVLAAATTGWTRQPVLAKVQPFTAYGAAVPGDRIQLEASLTDRSTDGCRAEVRATLDGALLADAVIYLALVDAGPPEAAALARRTLAELFPDWLAPACTPEVAL